MSGTKKVIFFIFCLLTNGLLFGCRPSQTEFIPVVEFSKIPPAGEGGADKIDVIEGTVRGSRPGQQIVLFAKSGTWWVQPFANQAMTEIHADSTWKSPTHLGTDYAALLVESGYRPPARIDQLPPVGEGVIAVAEVKGTEDHSIVTKNLKFSGYEWNVRTAASERGGMINNYSAANAWTDEKGFLHLRIRQENDKWTCAEISLPNSLGYGTYSFTIQDISNLEPAAVFGIFTWDDLEAGQNHREMDIEIARWGDPANKNLRYVIQPFYVPANVVQFSAPGGTLIHSIKWQPGTAEFETAESSKGKTSKIISTHTFASSVPASEGETIHLILYVFGYSKQPLERETEVIIEKFEYLP